MKWYTGIVGSKVNLTTWRTGIVAVGVFAIAALTVSLSSAYEPPSYCEGLFKKDRKHCVEYLEEELRRTFQILSESHPDSVIRRSAWQFIRPVTPMYNDHGEQVDIPWHMRANKLLGLHDDKGNRIKEVNNPYLDLLRLLKRQKKEISRLKELVERSEREKDRSLPELPILLGEETKSVETQSKTAPIVKRSWASESAFQCLVDLRSTLTSVMWGVG